MTIHLNSLSVVHVISYYLVVPTVRTAYQVWQPHCILTDPETNQNTSDGIIPVQRVVSKCMLMIPWTFTHARSIEHPATKQTGAVSSVGLPRMFMLNPYREKTQCMFLTARINNSVNPDILIDAHICGHYNSHKDILFKSSQSGYEQWSSPCSTPQAVVNTLKPVCSIYES